jgi:hypothetical protein
MMRGIVPTAQKLAVSILQVVAILGTVNQWLCDHALSDVQLGLVEEEQCTANVAFVEIDFSEREV